MQIFKGLNKCDVTLEATPEKTFCFNFQVSRDTMQSVLSMDITTLQSQLHGGRLEPYTVLQCFLRKVSSHHTCQPQRRPALTNHCTSPY